MDREQLLERLRKAYSLEWDAGREYGRWWAENCGTSQQLKDLWGLYQAEVYVDGQELAEMLVPDRRALFRTRTDHEFIDGKLEEVTCDESLHLEYWDRVHDMPLPSDAWCGGFVAHAAKVWDGIRQDLDPMTD